MSTDVSIGINFHYLNSDISINDEFVMALPSPVTVYFYGSFNEIFKDVWNAILT